MILLYPDTETEFDTNGLGPLSDAISCSVTEERNGVYELEMQYPLAGIHYADIKNRNIIFCKPDPYRDPQPFRIYRITRPLSGQVTIYARHISYDLSGVVVSPFSASSCTAALQGLKNNESTDTLFTYWTDIAQSGDFSIDIPSSIRSLLGGDENSILDIYQGEYEFDKWLIKLWNRRGNDNGVTIRYGKNLTDLQQDENISSVATGVYPYWEGGEDEIVILPEKIVNAPGTYNFQKIIPLDLSSNFEEKPTESQLRSAAEDYVKNNDIGIPAVSITVSFQPLEQTEGYKDITLLERVNLCDLVTVEYPDLGVSATAKCVKTVYDALKGRYSSIELGDAKTNIADTIANQQQQIEMLPESSAIQMAIQNATNLITGNRGGYVVMRDTNGDGEPDEILIMDKPTIESAQKIWRWNNGGLGYSSKGYNGPYTTAITQDGSIVASMITTGILNANLIKAGVIRALNNPRVYFDLEAGVIAATNMRSETTRNGDFDLYLGEVTSPTGQKRYGLGTTKNGKLFFTVGPGYNDSVRELRLYTNEFDMPYLLETTDSLFTLMAPVSDGESTQVLSVGPDTFQVGNVSLNFKDAYSGTISVSGTRITVKNGIITNAS